jgi:hypothetical protein
MPLIVGLASSLTEFLELHKVQSLSRQRHGSETPFCFNTRSSRQSVVWAKSMGPEVFAETPRYVNIHSPIRLWSEIWKLRVGMDWAGSAAPRTCARPIRKPDLHSKPSVNHRRFAQKAWFTCSIAVRAWFISLKCNARIACPSLPTRNAMRAILVVGATGQQGGAVVDALMAAAGSYTAIRALTRNPSTPHAQRLGRRGIELCRGDLSDIRTVEEALQRVNVAFLVTDFRGPGEVDGELKQGFQFVDAAKKADASTTHLSTTVLPSS